MPQALTILIADDDRDDHFFFEQAISETAPSYIIVKKVYDGREMMEYLSIANPKPDCIVLDLNMPILDGFSALMKLKSSDKLRSIPVFILTTSNKGSDREKCKELGCVEFYTKPYSISEFKNIIIDIFSKIVPHEMG